MQIPLTLHTKIRGLIQLFRPELPFAAGLCVLIGEMLVLGSFPPLRPAALGFMLGFFLSSSALIFNDYFDLEVDRINAPQRPLPAGLLTKAEVIALGIFTALVGLAAAWSLHPFVFGLSVLTWFAGFVYNWKLKAAGIWGNLTVSFSVAMTFLIGGIAVGEPYNRMAWTFGLFAFFFDLAEEIAADAMDAEGDQKRGSKSVAILRGKQTALRISALLFGIVVLVSLIPILLREASLPYILAIAFIDITIIFFVIKLLKSRSTEDGRRSIRALYLSASLGLIFFLAASFIL